LFGVKSSLSIGNGQLVVIENNRRPSWASRDGVADIKNSLEEQDPLSEDLPTFTDIEDHDGYSLL